ncbi:MAG: hypothetical protein IPJ77_00825 [Planctomycetes bacterium]|nr:hypothetical protein [Planctomycetota bacterium]
MSSIDDAGPHAWTIIAQDPSVLWNGRILRTRAVVPDERLLPGPRGHRVHVVDYDASARVQYKSGDEPREDAFAGAGDARLLSDPAFHRRNVYAIVMRTLATFERALGRRVDWGSGGHQLYVVPHAFCDANAFYSRADHALMFGYFPALPKRGGKKDELVFTCLSHDVVVHETTHALLDGLRERFMDPSHNDQAAFHEGFADVVALLSVFSTREVVGKVLDIAVQKAGKAAGVRRGEPMLPTAILGPKELARNGLFGLAEQMGQELPELRGDALRRSVTLRPSNRLYTSEQYEEPHVRGELLVAAVMQAFVACWAMRIAKLGEVSKGMVNRERAVEDGADLADALLTMAIRALDYCPPCDLSYPDYLSALLTADRELRRDDGRWGLRERLTKSFAAFGIDPVPGSDAAGCWQAPKHPERLVYRRTHFESLRRDPQEVFRFVWENLDELHVDPSAYTQVISVRPCMRVEPDGFVLHETVAEVHQTIELEARELSERGIDVPPGMAPEQRVVLFGGGTFVFDEYGRLKYEIHKRVDDQKRQSARLAYLWRQAPSDHDPSRPIGVGGDGQRLHRLHRMRATRWAGAPRKEDVL